VTDQNAPETRTQRAQPISLPEPTYAEVQNRMGPECADRHVIDDGDGVCGDCLWCDENTDSDCIVATDPKCAWCGHCLGNHASPDRCTCPAGSYDPGSVHQQGCPQRG
jgi:hypothetical protein